MLSVAVGVFSNQDAVEVEGGKTVRTPDNVKQERCYYIDWLRVLGMLAVFLFHCARFFDSMIDWHVKNGQQHMGFNVFIAFCGGWMMPLFFLLSGGSTFYALKRRSSKQYIGERFKRLVIPYIMGIFILIPPQRYMEALNKARFSGSYLDYYLRILKLDYFDHIDWSFGFLGYYGTHLWFIGLLFVLSVVALPLFLYLKRGTGPILSLSAVSERWGGIFLFAIPIALIHFIVHITFGRDTNWHGFCYYITIFIYGYILWSDKRFERAILKHRWIALATGILCFSSMMAWYAIGDAVAVVESRSYSLRALLFSALFGMNTWSWLIFILSIGIKRLSFSSKVLGYCNEAVLPFYALHQTVILVIGFFVVKWNLNMMLKYPIIAVGSMIVILAIYILLIRPINAVRFLFGMRLKK
jgi:glucan biosynthesis protein C